ncbi:hypothetical protein D3C71_1179870 [compost metagenome]
MHVVRHMRRHLRDDGCLGRANIGHDRTRLQRAGNLLGNGLRCTNGNRNDDEISILDRIGGRHHVFGAELQFFGAAERFLTARRNHHMFCKPELLDVAGDRRADQADTDQRDPLEMHVTHHFRPMNSPSASMTPRLASSEPTVMRSAFGRP